MLHAFRTSEEKHHLKYSGSPGDGESKSYSAVVHSIHADSSVMQIYVNIVKLEWTCSETYCKLLFDNVSELKSTQLREGGKSYKWIRGVAGLTGKSIRKIQGHYGGAIQGNVWRRR